MRKRDDDKTGDKPSAYDRALGLLARREHSRRELSRKLSAKGYTPDESAPAIAALSEGREQSDDRYAEVLIRQRSTAGYGPLRIEAELKSHGIDPRGCRELIAAIDWLELARAHVARRYGEAVTREGRDKAAQYLQRRGFPSGVIAKALGRGAD
jgi:regulatory protein